MRFSKTVAAFSVGVVSLPLLCPLLGAAPSKPADPSEAELLRRVETLEAKVAELEQKVAKSPKIELGTQPFLFAPGQIRSGNAKMPAGAVPREFNGETFYLVPVSQTDGAH